MCVCVHACMDCFLVRAWQRNSVADGARRDKPRPTCRQPLRLLQHNNTGTHRLVRFFPYTASRRLFKLFVDPSIYLVDQPWQTWQAAPIRRSFVSLCLQLPRELQSFRILEAWAWSCDRSYLFFSFFSFFLCLELPRSFFAPPWMTSTPFVSSNVNFSSPLFLSLSLSFFLSPSLSVCLWTPLYQGTVTILSIIGGTSIAKCSINFFFFCL